MKNVIILDEKSKCTEYFENANTLDFSEPTYVTLIGNGKKAAFCGIEKVHFPDTEELVVAIVKENGNTDVFFHGHDFYGVEYLGDYLLVRARPDSISLGG